MTAFSVASIAGVPAGIFLAARWGWNSPFLAVAALSAAFLVLAFFVLPPLRAHLDRPNEAANRPTPLGSLAMILRDANQRMALIFTLTLMLGHFTIIPFIAPYMQRNVGFSDHEVGYIYTLGGLMTVVVLPIFGRLADRFGHALVFTIASFFALFSIFAITHLPPVSIALALVATSSFFVVASGRNVPATAMSTAVVKAENRGSFMSLRQSVNEMALALSSFIAGLIVVEQPDGSLGNYAYVGYLAIGMSLVAVALAWRLKAEH
jgi:predicted MFS family arabinose efflux permease